MAYITRQPVQDLERAVQQLRYIAEDREDLVYTNSRNLPDWAQGKPHRYFKAAEDYERANGIAFEEWKITLPRELSHRENMAVMHDLVDALAGDTLPITYAFHAPGTLRQTGEQPHLHCIVSARKTDSHRRTPAGHFRRWNAAHPEQGGAQKDRTYGHKGAVAAHRAMIADIINVHLEARGYPGRVYPDRLNDHAIPRAPEPKLLPSDSAKYRRGTVTATMQKVMDIRAARHTSAQQEQQQLAAWWSARKATLGITDTMAMPERVGQVIQARKERVHEAPAAVRQGWRRRMEQQREHRLSPSQRLQVQSQRLAQRSAKLLHGPQVEEGYGAPLHVRLADDEERTREQHGMGY